MYVRAYTHKCNIHIHIDMYRPLYLCIYCMSIIDVIEEGIFLCHYSLDMAQWVVRYPLASHMAIGNCHFHRFLKGPKYGYVEMGGVSMPKLCRLQEDTRITITHVDKSCTQISAKDSWGFKMRNNDKIQEQWLMWFIP